MTPVLIDFEMTCWSNKDRIEAACREIIQIGAVKLNENLDVVDRMTLNVKPVFVDSISSKCTKITGLVWKDLSEAVVFEVALEILTEWMGSDVRIFAWGPDDKLQFLTECKTKNVDDEKLKPFEKWTDLQAVFKGLCGLKKRMSLTNALYIAGYDFEGKQHDAGDDAYNTARLIKHVFIPENRNKLRKSFGIDEEVEEGATIGDILALKFKELKLEAR